MEVTTSSLRRLQGIPTMTDEGGGVTGIPDCELLVLVTRAEAGLIAIILAEVPRASGNGLLRTLVLENLRGFFGENSRKGESFPGIAGYLAMEVYSTFAGYGPSC
jgi:hypothetical protein